MLSSTTWAVLLLAVSVSALFFLVKELEEEREKRKKLERRLKILENQVEVTKEDVISRRQSMTSLSSESEEFFDVEEGEGSVLLKGEAKKHPDYSKIDELFLGDKDCLVKALEIVSSFEKSHSDDFKFLCYLSCACVLNHPLYAREEPDLSQKKVLIERGIKAGKSALAIDPNSAEAHKWYAAAVGSKAEYLGFTEKLGNAKEFKKHVEIALEIDPEDYFANFLYGRLLFEFSKLNWFERAAASRLLSPVPSDCFTEALKHFLKAEKGCPRPWKEVYYYLMQCSLSKGDIEDSIRYAGIGAKLPAYSEEESRLHPEFEKTLSKYSAC
ncbi:regulator of microtubule dynamics protein 2-like [Artemia franciscana]|uniref:Regulator of microtubule dynamics protein 1 n=1 Tax=Artemia franciscana TaxID=6661 RepID=A0AA88H740_ARTSF|nr:hypothetical protein QYM36_016508 [Artemia franciscana]KAK2706495.1 hypothetical protein QYM36_016508 [Artemia franciscana]